MFFWVTATLLTLCACLALLWPFLRGRPVAATQAEAHDVEVYRDQLRELDRDLARGTIAAAEAAQARAEIGRRLLASDGALAGGQPDSRPQSRLPLAIASAAILAVPIVSWSVYVAIGSPRMPDQPLSARLEADPANSSAAELVARAERHLAENPQDGRGWDVLAPIYLRMGRSADAATAYRNAIRINGESAARQGGLGEALVAVAGGIVTDEAHAAFEAGRDQDPADARSRFFLALARAQEGDAAGSLAQWRTLEAELPPDNPWKMAAAQAVARADEISRQAGPDRSSGGAVAEGDGAEQARMIAGMVEGLDQRLRESSGTVEEWERLIRSYMVLGREADARDALLRGRSAMGEQSAEAQRLVAFAQELGLAEAVR